MNKQNRSFIHNSCELCGKGELSLSVLRLSCNYGSRNDGEDIALYICGDCADKIYNSVKGGGYRWLS